MIYRKLTGPGENRFSFKSVINFFRKSVCISKTATDRKQAPSEIDSASSFTLGSLPFVK